MKKQLILYIFAIALCNKAFLGCQYPDPSKKQISLKLDDQFQTKLQFLSFGQVLVPFNLFSIQSHITAPDCVNCDLYGNGEEIPDLCIQDNFCQNQYLFDRQVIDQYFEASGNAVRLVYLLDTLQVSVPSVMNVRKVHELAFNKVYHFQSIGLALDRSSQSTLIYSLVQQGKLDNYAYSLYYGIDNSYHLTIGGYNPKFISREFYNIQTVSDDLYSPYQIKNDLIVADLLIGSKSVATNASVLLDPTIDGIILPTSLYYAFYDGIKTSHLEPNLLPFSMGYPGKWSSLDTSPSFTISFILKDEDAISRSIDVVFTPEQFMNKDEDGNYSPKISFAIDTKQTDDDFNVIRVGKILFKQVMYYKFILVNVDGSFNKEMRCLAPLVKNKSASE